MMNKINELLDSGTVYEIVLSLVLALVFLILKKTIKQIASKRAEAHNFDKNRITYIKNAVGLGLWLIFGVGLAMVWNVSFKGLSVYIASIFTVLGVGLFANWSMISNITAAVILFFFFPFSMGSKVKIVDGDNSVEGVVLGLSLFSIHIEREDGKHMYFPNNLALQKTVIHLNSNDNKED